MKVNLSSGVLAQFPDIQPTLYKDSLVGLSADKKFHIKIEYIPTTRKSHSLYEEAKILRYLNDKNCRTCVKIMLITSVLGKDLAGSVNNSVELDPDHDYTLMVTESAELMTPLYTPDIAMAVIEQKKLGVWNGDLTQGDVMVDPKTNCIKIVDYDQAVMLSDEQINMTNLEFFKWINDHAIERWGMHGMTSFLFNMKLEWDVHFANSFDGDCFNIAGTHLFQSQETTLDAGKIYHSFRTEDVYAKGERSLDERKRYLDRIEFEDGERVLDVGCNAGLLCHYLDERGCVVWGIDIDPSVIEGAQILANIVGKPDINFQCHDVDNGGPIGYFDTILLFSVIHHTLNIHKNAERIAKLCNRIIIECRLKEQGAKPIEGKWIQTTVWEHEDLDSLTAGLEVLFPGFKFIRVLGQGDRGRYVMEFIKAS